MSATISDYFNKASNMGGSYPAVATVTAARSTGGSTLSCDDLSTWATDTPVHFSTFAVNADGTIDFSDWHYGVDFIVSDYINEHKYNVVVRLYDPTEGIETIEVGTWVNIYDIYGRKVATTNEDLRTMTLPHGIYIVVTESGQTIKIMK